MELKLFLILELYIRRPISLFSFIIKVIKFILITLLTTLVIYKGAQ
jgi:hypothetical protein